MLCCNLSGTLGLSLKIRRICNAAKLSSKGLLLAAVSMLLSLAGMPQASAQSFAGGAITINDNANASPYPSTITVSGVTGTITSVRVKLNAFTHSFPADVDIFLVAPDGKVAVVMSDALGGEDLIDVNFVFDDDAPTVIPAGTTASAGTYRPFDYTANEALPPGATGPLLSSLTDLAAGGANGSWKLYVRDDAAEDTGDIGSWTLEIIGNDSRIAVEASTFPGDPQLDGVVAWGNSGVATDVPQQAESGLIAIASGNNYNLGVTSDGRVVAWGDNGSGQTTVPAAAQSGVIAIAAGIDHGVALRNDGSVVAWGGNAHGQTTVPAAALSGAIAIAAGDGYTLALKRDGTLLRWGLNSTFLPTSPGDYSAIAAGRPDLFLRSDGTLTFGGSGTVPPATALTDVTAMAGGFSHDAVLKNDGSVVAWGSNSFGESTVPAEAQSEVIAIALGGRDNSLALKSDGRVIAWGRYVVVPPAALSGVTAISAGSEGLALKRQTRVVAWGSNTDGITTVPVEAQSGLSAISAGASHTLALKSNGSVAAWGNNFYGQSTVPVEAQAGVTAVAAGGYHNLALKGNRVIAWGLNNAGQATVPLEAKSAIAAIAGGESHSVALTVHGAVLAWGIGTTTGSHPNYGQSIVPTTAQSNVIAISAGDFHTVALKRFGVVVAWGFNNEGQATVPTEAMTNVKAIAAGGAHTLALKNDGSVIAWGRDFEGQSTVPAAAQSGVKAIAAGRLFSLALKADGSVIAWGTNDEGQRIPPDALRSGAVAISAGYDHAVALDTVVNLDEKAVGSPDSSITCSVKNLGTSPLTINSVSLTGANSADFTLNTSGMDTTVPGGGETYFSVRFHYNAGASALRTATVLIDSSDPTRNPVDLTVQGVVLSGSLDSDADGMNDLAESELSVFGFDWRTGGTEQTALVNSLLANSNSAGLYNLSQVQALHVDTPLLQKNGAGQFKLTIGVEKSTTLLSGSFNPLPLTPSGTTINGNGKLEFLFTSPEPVEFFRVETGK